MDPAGDLRLGVITVNPTIPQRVAHPRDLALARRAAARDETAWREIYDRTRERLFGLLAYYAGNREDALELLQETYLSAVDSIERYGGTGPLDAWLAVIAIRRARDWKRRLVRWRRRREALAAEHRGDPPAVHDPDARRRLHGALATLKGKQRGAFLLRELEGLDFQSVGRALGCSPATARVHYFRARQAMQHLLESEATEEGDRAAAAAPQAGMNPVHPGADPGGKEETP
ncbi:MAG: sigma-70 family RNA polymerase sigma factor [Candidatus Eisenbacteria bacterium]|nr:sigma-70 family RNA polymerase sigma factor [Candidatus Eisenbacteria bacterium]